MSPDVDTCRTLPAHQRPGDEMLADGRHVVIRPLTRSDAPALEAAVQVADREDLHRRFLGSPPSVEHILRQLDRIDLMTDFAMAAFDDAGRLVGVAQFDRCQTQPATAEVAIEVASGWQRRGLGTRLMKRLALLALAMGISRFTATYYADNVGVQRLLRSLGRVSSSAIEQGQGYCEIDLLGLAGGRSFGTKASSPGPAAAETLLAGGDPT